MKSRLFILAAALLMLAVSAWPQATPKSAKPPVISDALKVKFFKSQMQLRDAQAAYQQAQQASMDAGNEITRTCGDGFVAQMDAQGDPVCVVKPEAKK